MTTELEKEFFRIFKIKPTTKCCIVNRKIKKEHIEWLEQYQEKYANNDNYLLIEKVDIYPTITDSHTLELLAILMKKTTCHLVGHDLTSKEKIKNTILQKHIDIQKNKLFDLANMYQDEVRKKVQAIFKGER